MDIGAPPYAASPGRASQDVGKNVMDDWLNWDGALIGLRRKPLNQRVHNALRRWRRRRAAPIMIPNNRPDQIIRHRARHSVPCGRWHPQAVDVSIVAHRCFFGFWFRSMLLAVHERLLISWAMGAGILKGGHRPWRCKATTKATAWPTTCGQKWAWWRLW